MLIGTILVYIHMNSVLFDLGFTFSYVSARFALGWDLTCEILNASMYVSTLVGLFMCID